MIKLTEYIDSEICKVNLLYNPLSEKIVSLYNLRDKPNSVLVYSQIDDDGNITGIILNASSEVTVSINEKSDINELKDFLNCIGYNSVILNREIYLNCKRRHGFIIKHSGDDIHQNNLAQMISSEDIKNVYPLIKQNFEICPDFPEWYCDFSHKIRHGNAEMTAVKIDDAYASCAAYMYKTNYSATIMSVCTDECFRNKGYARDCVSKLVYELKEKNVEDIFLLCKENVIDFYKKLKFEIIGRWYEYVQ